MPKTKDAFAFRNFDATRILQRPYFKKFREEYHIADTTDELILESLKATEGNSLELLETKLKTLQVANTLLIRFHDLINRHETRLNKYNKRSAENQRGAPMIDYFTAELDTMEINNKFVDSILEIGKKIQQKCRNEFAERLKKSRKTAGLTQRQLADMIQVSPTGFAQYEQGRNDPSLLTLRRISKVLKVSSDELLGLSP